MNNKLEACIKLMLSAILTVLFQMDIDMNILPSESFYGKSMVFEVFLFIIFYYSFRIWKNNKTNYKVWSLITASILAVFYVLGYNIERYSDIFTEFNHNWMWGKLFLKWIVCWYCFATMIMLIYIKINCLKQLNICGKIKNVSISRRQIVLMLFISICWLPALINNFPGILYGDSWNQIYQALGIEQISTHHPIIHTLFLKLCLIICNDIESGIILYTLISFIVIITIISYIINLMLEEDFDIRIIITAILLYAFFPSISMFTITITKDSWFAVFVGLFLIEIYILVINHKHTTRHFTGLIIAAISVGLFRKNGIYLLIFLLIYLLLLMLIKKEKVGKILIICLFSICINAGIEYAIPHIFNISSASPREMLSLSIQQMARIEKNVHDLDDKITSEIDSFFSEDANLGDAYYPLISDNAKSMFCDENFYGREKEFVTLSMRLLFLYPEESLEAFMCNSYGYWYPIAINWYYAQNNNEPISIKTSIKKHEYPQNVDYVNFNEIKYIAGLDFFNSIGIIFWIFIIIAGYLIADRKYGELQLMVPLCALWVTSIASPVYNELRYVLAIYLVLPIIFQLVIQRNPCLKNETISFKRQGAIQHSYGMKKALFKPSSFGMNLCEIFISTLISFSLWGFRFLEAESINDYIIWLICLVICSAITKIFISLVITQLKKLHFYPNYGDRTVALKCTIIFAVQSIIYWLAFYPGNMFTDTYFQFLQIFNYQPPGDWHPYGHTLLMKIILKLTDKPEMIVFLQIITMLYIMFLIFNELSKLGYHRKLLYIISFLLSVNVSYGLQITNIWKDTLYTISLLYILFFLYKNYESKFVHLKVPIIGGLGFMGTLLFRHNGSLVCIITLLIMLILSRFKRETVIFACIIYGTYLLLTNYGFSAMGVVPNAKVTTYLPMLHGIAAVEEKYGSEGLDSQTKQLMNELLPEEVWINKYDPYNGDPYLFETEGVLQENCELYSTSDILMPYVKTFLKYPFIIIKDRLASCELVWSLMQTEGSYNHIIGVSIDNNTFENDSRLNSDLNIQIKTTNNITILVQKCFDFIYNNLVLNIIHFRPAWLIWILSIVLLISAIYDMKSIIIAAPICLNVVTLLIAMNFQAYRYVWGVFVNVPIIILLLLGKKIFSLKSDM